MVSIPRIALLSLISVVLIMTAVVAAPPTTYQAALKDAQAKEQPLLVLIGATWCPGCQTMKQTVLPLAERQGVMQAVSYVTVDADSDRDIASQLMRGTMIPQLIVFAKTPEGKWHREQITGETSVAQVKSLISRAVIAQKPTDGSSVATTGATGN